MTWTLCRINSAALNDWLTERHYLHRPIIKSKLLAHGVFVGGELVGGVLWATPHFTRKRGLFGMPGTLDKWEVLMLARFYLAPDSGLVASDVLGESIGRAGRNAKSKRRRGWRLQQDWVIENPPPFPNAPFVPRLLISWSDYALPAVECCATCGASHTGQHEGIIYKASGWQLWDVSTSSGVRTAQGGSDGEKRCWVLPLPENRRAESMGRAPEQLMLEAA